MEYRHSAASLAAFRYASRSGARRALLLEGPPGAGKSALAQVIADHLGAKLVVYQAHAWTDADELFVGVDVVAAVAGDADGVRQLGVLAQVAEISQKEPVVLLLDEIDKTSEAAEALLLDWLQSGRVPVRPGIQIQTRLDQVVVIATSNAVRPLSDALLRRFRRAWLDVLPVDVQVQMLSAESRIPVGLIRSAWAIARDIAVAEGNRSLSIQEGQELMAELWLCQSRDEALQAFLGWAARHEDGRRAAMKANGRISQVYYDLDLWRRGRV